VQHVADKLEAMGANLLFPHQSAVRGAPDLRELRPRAGRSPWRAFYRQVARDVFAVAAVGPEAEVDPQGFRQACQRAKDRLALLREDKP
jgi:hypothetical protein